MKIAISYANDKFKNTQLYNAKTAEKKGNFDKIISYSPEDIDDSFKEKNRLILESKRGNGYWLWKPYFVYRTLSECNDGDYVFYCDSGAFYVNKIDYLIKALESSKQDMLVFELPFLESQFTKRDIFIHLNQDTKKYSDSNQIMATCFLIKKTKTTLKFVKEWLELCQIKELITDDDNIMYKKKNYDNFIENRHDQSIFSLLCKKYNLIPHRDPCQFGENFKKYYKDKYPTIIYSHRLPEIDNITAFKMRFTLLKMYLSNKLPVNITRCIRKILNFLRKN